MNVRFVSGSLAVIYLIVFMINLFGAAALTQWKEPFGYGLLALAVIALGLHIAIVAISRSWMSAFLGLACILALFVLILRALMIVTGDSL